MTAFISYEKFFGLKCKFEMNLPPFDILDANTLITWHNIRKLGINHKRKTSQYIDYAAFILFLYLIVICFVFVSYTFFDNEYFKILMNTPFIYAYVCIDIILLMIAFFYRIYQ